MIEIRHNGINNTAATQKAYNEIYSSTGIQLRDSFYIWLLSLLKAPKGASLLDISSGQGRLVELARAQGLNASGVDFALSAVHLSKMMYPKANWLVGDGENLPIRNKPYDFITHIGSLEHYEDPATGVREIARLLKPGGTACILLPNTFSLIGNIKHVWKTGEVFDDGQPLQRYSTMQGWKKLLQKNGLQPFRIVKYEKEWPLTRQDLIWYLTHPAKLAHLLISIAIPTNLANCLVYLCTSS